MDRRHFNRIIFSSQAELSQDDKIWQTELLDLSLKGALLKLPANFAYDANGYLTLNFVLDGLPNPISMKGKIRHRDNQQLGFQCELLDIDSATELRRLIELNISDEAILNRDLMALSHIPQST